MPWPEEAGCTFLWGISPLSATVFLAEGHSQPWMADAEPQMAALAQGSQDQSKAGSFSCSEQPGVARAHIDTKKPSPTTAPDAQGRGAFSPSLTLSTPPPPAPNLSFPFHYIQLRNVKRYPPLGKENDKLSIFSILV